MESKAGKEGRRMTVSDLIKKLKALPGDAVVVHLRDYDRDEYELYRDVPEKASMKLLNDGKNGLGVIYGGKGKHRVVSI